jgi:hypothetical protein
LSSTTLLIQKDSQRRLRSRRGGLERADQSDTCFGLVRGTQGDSPGIGTRPHMHDYANDLIVVGILQHSL